MSGETELTLLLQQMEPTLQAEEYVFCTLGESQLQNLALHPICLFREDEGVTVIVLRSEAEELDIAYSYPSRLITLTIHSSLEAVGFLAAITTRLAENAISVNAVSAYYHDHLFVPSERAEEALRLLKEIAAR